MHVIGVGELLWDELPDGPRIGGAPFNVVAQLAQLGYGAAYVTAVGRDRLGDAALDELRARRVDTTAVQQVTDAPTGVARVVLGDGGSPAFEIVRPAAYEHLRLDAATVTQLTRQPAAALVFGTLAHRAPHVLDGTRRLAARLEGAVRVYDVNLRTGWWSPDLVGDLAALATIVKVSDAEAPALAPVFEAPWPDAEAFCRTLAARLGLRGVAISGGGAVGSLLLDGTFVQGQPPEVTVADTVGAGDAFVAGITDAVCRGFPAAAALRRANALGALVASRTGALPTWTAEELAEHEQRTAAPGPAAAG